MSYKEKLIKWNDTLKYKQEIFFLERLIDGNTPILDFGCGTGFAAMYLNADGYDVNNYLTYPIKPFNQNTIYKTVYFMHSFAHLEQPELELIKLKRYSPRIIIITPNRDWLDKDYVGDTTVTRHYSQRELIDLVEGAGYTIELAGQFGELKNNQHERLFLTAI